MSSSVSGKGMARKLLVGLAAVALGTAACSASATPTPTATPGIHWLVTAAALPLISGSTGNQKLVTNAFDNARTDIMGPPPAGWAPPVAQVRGFESLADFRSAFPNLAPGTWVLYDLESWSASDPDNTDPATYLKNFVALAHSNPDPSKWLHVIAAPAADVGSAITVSSCNVAGEPGWRNYVDNCDVPAMVGEAKPDLFEIQSQSIERCTDSKVKNCATTFPTFVGDSLAQARTKDPGLTALAGLSTNPSGATSSGAVLDTDTRNTASMVEGYWLNVPQKGSACKLCQPGGEPQVAVDYLHDLGYTG
ncbi:MAG TPA: hypothetical protein VG247_21795 [Pseudonocardiaceae bacterium]|nr:hypothetical protein [Pseudonocardiaceae bacterium]